MASKLSSIYFMRAIRGQRRRLPNQVIETLKKENIPLAEDDFTRLEKKAGQNYDYKSLSLHKEMPPPSSFPDENTEKRKFVKMPDMMAVHEKFCGPNLEMDLQFGASVNHDNQYDLLNYHITPFYSLSYNKQLRIKHTYCKDVMRRLSRRLQAKNARVRSTSSGLACHVHGVCPSPEIIKYRNKDEFSVNVGVDGNPKTVGFYLSSPSESGVVKCIPPIHLINIRDSHKLVAKHFQDYINDSPHETCFSFKKGGGVWRKLAVRSSLSGQIMAIVTVSPFDLNEEDLETIKNSLKKYFWEGPGSECGLSSLYIQPCGQTYCPREKVPYQLIFGETHLQEECLQKKFLISPDSFFQVNTLAAEVLYKSVMEMSELSPHNTVLDICSGTGTISIISSPTVRGAIGIEHVSGAVEDAERNAILNNANNVNFILGRSEKILPNLTNLLGSADVVAIVNPPRNGLHRDVIQAIRNCPAIKKLVYISCKAEGQLLKNFIQLCKLRESVQHPVESYPFVMRRAVPVDLFPHCPHVEVAFLFERDEM